MDSNEVNRVDLSFGPAWARQTPEKLVFHETDSKRRSSGPGREERRGQNQGSGGSRFGNLRDRKARGPRREYAREPLPQPRQAPREPPPLINVSFIPERNGLKPLVTQLSSTRRAYSLFEIAVSFLRKPEFYAAAITSLGNDGVPPKALYQCAECKMIFTNRQLAVAHGLSRHSDLFYEKEEKESEPPQGNFLCVARCTLSGELLGPPNYHEFNERLQELYKSRFAGLSFEQYRKKIVNETDPALIEQWKKQAARKTIYRAKPPREQVVITSLLQLEKHFAENYAAALIREGLRFIIPATISHGLDDRHLEYSIQEAFKKEINFPINMAIAIQKRFRRLGLHIFKTPPFKATFVSAVRPHALDPEKATSAIRNILEWLRAHPGKTRQDLAAALAAGAPQDSAAVAELINSLVWLIDRGHVIEFMNGTLSVPNRGSIHNTAQKPPAPAPNGAKISPGSPQARPPRTVLPSKMEGEAVLSRQQNGAKTPTVKSNHA